MPAAFCGVFRSQRTCLVDPSHMLAGTNSASLNPLAGFERPLRGGRKRGKGKRKKRKERDGRNPRKHPPHNKFLVGLGRRVIDYTWNCQRSHQRRVAWCNESFAAHYTTLQLLRQSVLHHVNVDPKSPSSSSLLSMTHRLYPVKV